MNTTDYTTTITVNASPHHAFKCINNVSAWWTKDLKGNTHKLNDEFSVQFGDVHFSNQKLVEIIPDKKIVWLVTDSKLNFVKDTHEWTGTKVSFEIFESNNKTQVRFTHFGLVPTVECFGACSNAWSEYIQEHLRKYVNENAWI